MEKLYCDKCKKRVGFFRGYVCYNTIGLPRVVHLCKKCATAVEEAIKENIETDEAPKEVDYVLPQCVKDKIRETYQKK